MLHATWTNIVESTPMLSREHDSAFIARLYTVSLAPQGNKPAK